MKPMCKPAGNGNKKHINTALSVVTATFSPGNGCQAMLCFTRVCEVFSLFVLQSILLLKITSFCPNMTYKKQPSIRLMTAFCYLSTFPKIILLLFVIRLCWFFDSCNMILYIVCRINRLAFVFSADSLYHSYLFIFSSIQFLQQKDTSANPFWG